MLFLELAQLTTGEFIHIDDYRAETVLCPYCQKPLRPKRGCTNRHHFAHHANESCVMLTQHIPNIAVPLYTDFTLSLTPQEKLALHTLYDVVGDRWFIRKSHPRQRGAHTAQEILRSKTSIANRHRVLHNLLDKGFLEKDYREFEWFYHVTQQGLAVCTGLPIHTFYAVQQELVAQKRSELLAHKIIDDTQLRLFHEQDCHMFHTQVDRLTSYLLYLLRIETDRDVYYKVGITQNLERRRLEVVSALRPYLRRPTVFVLFQRQGWAACERYIMLRWQTYQQVFGSMREFFTEEFPVNDVLKELG